MNAPAAVGGGAQALLAQAAGLLREQAQLARQDERGAAEQAIEATEQRAEHAMDRAEAMRSAAMLRLAMTVSGQLLGLGSTALGFAAEAPRSNSRLSSDLQTASEVTEQLTGLCDMGPNGFVAATDDAFGFGAEARDFEAAMEQDSLRADRAEFVEGNHRARREELEEQLSAVRQAVRDMANSDQGGV